jgi:hypothetical protein
MVIERIKNDPTLRDSLLRARLALLALVERL